MNNEINNNCLGMDIANIGKPTGAGGNKRKIEPDIYEAVCIAVCDAGISTKNYQGKEKKVQNVVLVWQLDHVNGFGSQSVVTDWVAVSGHENSNFMKNFIVPTKLNVKLIGDIVGKAVRMEIDHTEQGYPTIARYFASKKAIDVVDGLYVPAWIYAKGYPMLKHVKVLDGTRPKTEKSVEPQKPAIVSEEAKGDDLPF